MADEGFDARRETLIVETRTLWDAELEKLSPQDKEWLAQAVHAAPAKAKHVAYEREHTGFTRIITVTKADVQRLYAEKQAH